MTTFVSTKSFQEAVENYINNLNLESLNSYDVINALDISSIDSPDELESAVESVDEYSYFSTEIIYYSVAMEFLMKNDDSLKQSLSLASEMGYELDSLNSETLASLLATDYAITEWYEIKDDIVNEFKYSEILNTDDVLEHNLISLELIAEVHNEDSKDWFSCLINRINSELVVLIDQDGLDESKLLESLPYITAEELNEGEDICYLELDMDEIIIHAEEFTIVIQE